MMNTPRRSGLPAPQSSSFSSDAQTPAKTLVPRKSLAGLRQAAAASDAGSSGNVGEATPKRASWQQHAPPASTMPSTTASATAATAAEPPKRKLEIGDEVVAEVNQTRFTGVLRHLGPVHFRPGIFAGLELTFDSVGQGKNDGSVDGQQYFACEPGNGMFCPAAKVKWTSSAPATEATARPRSAMSSRSGRSSVSDIHADRPPSVTPGRPRSSMAASNGSALPRPPSTTPGRPSMRSSIGAGRPSSSLATPSAKLPRLLPRRSVADGLADEEGRRRAKTSAEEAAKAEGRITEGSRAHQYLNMSTKELEARRLRTTGSGNVVARPAGRPSSPNKANVSPLKESLLGSGGSSGASRLPPTTPRVRSSMGTAQQSAAMITPKAAKSRTSIFSAASKAANSAATANSRAMAPPIGNGSPAKLAPPTSARTSGAHASVPRTPSRLSTSHASSDGSEADGDGTKARNRSLLEQMALLTPRHAPPELASSGDADESLPVFEGDYNDGEVIGAGLALLPDGEADVDGGDVAHAVVPLSLYEESNLEITQLKAQLNEAKQLQERAKEEQKVDTERARMLALEEIRREMDEERTVERQDEQRRRKAELEEREQEWKSKLDGVQKELRKVQDEHGRAKTEHETSVSELEARLKEQQTLVDTLKQSALREGNDEKADTAAQGQLQAKDMEIAQLTQRVERVEASRDQERTAMLKEIDELKDAGQEALDMFDREQSLSNARIVELENNMHLLEARAQEAIQDAIRERDEALQGGQKRSSVQEISHRSLEEQLAQAQTRAASLEDQLSESSSILQQEREAFVKRKDRYVQSETKLKTDIAQLKKRVQQIEEAEVASQQRIEELNDALAESRSALESERSELETLRAEAMIMGEGPDGQAVQALEHGRFEAEIERLNGLLEGARSGKREAQRTADALRKQVNEMHGLLDEARVQIEAGKRQSLTVPQSPTNRISVDSSAGGSTMESDLASPSMARAVSHNGGSATSPNLSTTDKRFSSASTHSRRSYGSAGGGSGTPHMTPSEAQSKELAGLRSIVNTLNQELTEVKVHAKQQERELRAQIARYKAEVAQLEEVDGSRQKAGSQGGEEGTLSNDSSVMTSDGRAASQRSSISDAKLRDYEAQVAMLQQQLATIEQSKRDEVQKLQQDIAELEALCEATVWRREEQEAKRQELERKVAKLQRQLDRVQEYESRHAAKAGGGGGVADNSTAAQDSTTALPTTVTEKLPPLPPPPPAQPQWSHTPFVRNNNGGDRTSVASNAASLASTISSSANTQADTDGAAVGVPISGPCVECNEEGHTIDDCPYLNDDVLF